MNTDVYQKIKIKEIREETKDSKTFVLDPLDAAIAYRAGQYINFAFDSLNGEERRSYSFSSSPNKDSFYSITVKRVENGAYSRYFIDEAVVGDVLYSPGIAGLFTLPENTEDYQQLFFLAAGSGIVPIFSLIKTALYSFPHLHVTLIYSNRSVDTTIFHDQLITLQNEYSGRFAVDFLFSSSDNILRSRLTNSLLTIMLGEHGIAPFANTLFYTCGPLEYMDTVSITLLTEGVPKENIRKEIFVGYIPEVLEPPPDTAEHNVTILLKDKKVTLKVQYPTSILETAKQEGIALPYSCQSGQCGSCTAVCTKGEVWIAYNEVLTDADLKNGLVLTCQGFPINGDVELSYKQ